MQRFRYTRCHGRGDFRAFVDTAEVVVQEVQRQHLDVIVDLRRERIRQTREATVPHADIQAHPLHITRADIFLRGLALKTALTGARAYSRVVTALRGGVFPVVFNVLLSPTRGDLGNPYGIPDHIGGAFLSFGPLGILATTYEIGQ